jgi:hypothetical protein
MSKPNRHPNHLLEPEDVRAKYPGGWQRAGYRPIPGAMAAALVRGEG